MQSQNAHIDLERFRVFYLFYPFLNNYVLITQKYLKYRQSCAQKMDPSSPGPSRLLLKIKPVPFHGDACNMSSHSLNILEMMFFAINKQSQLCFKNRRTLTCKYFLQHMYAMYLVLINY